MIGELKYLTVEDIKYIKPRIREYDKRELEVQGWIDDLHLLPEFEHAYCYSVKSEPIAALGAIETDHVLHLWFFSTDEITKYWESATDFARGFLSWLQRKYFGKHIMVQCMKSHRASMLWLKRLGFKPTKHETVKNGEQLIMMEFI